MDKEEGKKGINRLAKYSALAFQLLAFIAIGYFIGSWVDSKWGNGQSYGVALLSTVFLILGLVYVVRDILREK